MGKKVLKYVGTLALTILILFVSFISAVIIELSLLELNNVVRGMLEAIFPILFVPFLFKKKRRLVFILVIIYVFATLLAMAGNYMYIDYDKKITIREDDFNLDEYLPFDASSKIAKLEGDASLKLEKNLPKLNGTRFMFPLYSSFVNAVYPNTTRLNDDIFMYTVGVEGYEFLAQKDIDVCFGSYLLKEKLKDAEEQGIEFEFTEIGKDALVFHVNKNNPVDSLTAEQIKDIYSGKITNWSEVGGKDEAIIPFQRGKSSESQSVFIDFMGDESIIPPEEEDFKVGKARTIIKVVADYKNYKNSIGFSSGAYMEGIIKIPNVKILSIDGVAPTLENISSGKYGITKSLYAVTYKDNPNENVKKLIEWILSEEGQELVEKAGYARVN